MLEASIQLDYQPAREHVRHRDRIEGAWREVDAHAQYGLRVSPDELRSIVERIDAIVRPYIAATPAGCAGRRRHRQHLAPRVPPPDLRPGLEMTSRTAFAIPAFRRLWGAGLISDTGDWLLFIALPSSSSS